MYCSGLYSSLLYWALLMAITKYSLTITMTLISIVKWELSFHFRYTNTWASTYNFRMCGEWFEFLWQISFVNTAINFLSFVWQVQVERNDLSATVKWNVHCDLIMHMVVIRNTNTNTMQISKLYVLLASMSGCQRFILYSNQIFLWVEYNRYIWCVT